MAKNKTSAHSTGNWTAVVAVPASGPGALAGYEATCLHCSATYGSSTQSTLTLDMQDHDRFMVKMGK